MVVPCTPVADPNEGSSCTSNTSVDALVPGAATEGKRGVWALGRIAVYDSGADGDADTPAGDALFATQEHLQSMRALLSRDCGVRDIAASGP